MEEGNALRTTLELNIAEMKDFQRNLTEVNKKAQVAREKAQLPTELNNLTANIHQNMIATQEMLLGVREVTQGFKLITDAKGGGLQERDLTANNEAMSSLRKATINPKVASLFALRETAKVTATSSPSSQTTIAVSEQ